jgi:hypothetical protein
VLLVVTGLLGLAPPARGDRPGWHATLDDGIAAAKASGRPVFLVTLWKTSV